MFEINGLKCNKTLGFFAATDSHTHTKEFTYTWKKIFVA